MVTLLTSPPPSLSPEEHTELSASTPASFEGIPPLLRHKEEGVTVSIEPEVEGVSFLHGDLYVTDGALSVYSPSTSQGITIPYPQITLHAISRMAIPRAAGANGVNGHSNGDVPPGPCLYCQIDENEGEGEDDEEPSTREVIIAPTNAAAVDVIFEKLSQCASLHPSRSSENDAGGLGGFGLDPDSMVYADADGNLQGPGLDGEDEDDEGQEPSGGRQRSDFVANTRRGPY